MILIGVCGGIAAYKSCELVRTLVRGGHDVQVVLTPAAERFVGPTTFAALSRRPVLTEEALDVFPHLAASGEAELMCIAPLTATTLARLAHGDAVDRPHRQRAGTGRAAAGGAGDEPADVGGGRNAAQRCRLRGPGGRADRARRRGHRRGRAGDRPDGGAGDDRRGLVARLEAGRRLAGRSVLVTAGGTREPLDAVRYVGNRSSGKMGVAVADEAARRGADVTLVLAAASASPSAPMRTVQRVDRRRAGDRDAGRGRGCRRRGDERGRVGLHPGRTGCRQADEGW